MCLNYKLYNSAPVRGEQNVCAVHMSEFHFIDCPQEQQIDQ